MFVLREKLLCPGEPLHLAAAVSGGADSMALLRILLALQPEFGFVLSACHVNHGLRGETADRDEAFVRAECARLGVPLRVFHAAEMADEVGLPSEHAGEDWARRLRYACFARLCGEGIDVVATAHTANDQAETLLLRLARGTGLHGAAGIRPKRGCYLRPLLALTRQDTESFCRAAGQAWVTDETNATDAYARNRVRRAALPALQSTNGAAVETLPASARRQPARMPILPGRPKSCFLLHVWMRHRLPSKPGSLHGVAAGPRFPLRMRLFWKQPCTR